MIRACPVCRAPAGCVTGCPEALPEPDPTERAMGAVEDWCQHRFGTTPARKGVTLEVHGSELRVVGLQSGIDDLLTVLVFDGFEVYEDVDMIHVWEEEP